MSNTLLNTQFLVVSRNAKMETGLRDLMMTESGAKALQRLMAFKASERKDDPDRHQGIHGPYEELLIQKTGTLPDDYYVAGDDIPWGLRIQESRSNILWQVLSGMLDHRPEFAAAYMGLVLDQSLNVDEHKRELEKIHKSWTEYHSTKSIFNNHQHGAAKYHSVACPACSVLTAMVCQDEAMNDLFKKLIPMSFEDRNSFMVEQGFATLLDVMIPKTPILIENHI
jgi:hypothetical protein